MFWAAPRVKGAEKHSGIEAMSLRESLKKSKVEICWVDWGGHPLLANVLTKTSEQGWLHAPLRQ